MISDLGFEVIVSGHEMDASSEAPELAGQTESRWARFIIGPGGFCEFHKALIWIEVVRITLPTYDFAFGLSARRTDLLNLREWNPSS